MLIFMINCSICYLLFSEREFTPYVIVGPSVCLSVVCNVLLRRLKFSAMYLHHVVPWPSVTFVKNFTEIVPGEPLRRGS